MKRGHRHSKRQFFWALWSSCFCNRFTSVIFLLPVYLLQPLFCLSLLWAFNTNLLIDPLRHGIDEVGDSQSINGYIFSSVLLIASYSLSLKVCSRHFWTRAHLSVAVFKFSFWSMRRPPRPSGRVSPLAVCLAARMRVLLSSQPRQAVMP